MIALIRGQTAPARRLQLIVTLKRHSHCISCGTDFQKTKPDVPGFQQITRMSRKPSVYADSDSLIDQLSPEQQRALGETSIPKSTETQRFLHQERLKKKWLKQSLHCRWCLDSRSGNTNPIDYPAAPHVPKDALKFHVIDALDFPFGVPAQHTPGTKYIINRVDLVARHASKVSNFKEYVMKEVFSKLRVSAADVFCVSALRQWGLKKLSERFGNGQNWLIGDSCAGKSALALTLAGESSLPDSCWPMPYKSQQPIYHKALQQYRSKEIVDSPSDTNNKLPEIIKPKYLRKLVAGTPLFLKDPKYQKIKIKARPGQSVSIGGVLALELPKCTEGSSIHFFVAVGGLSDINARVFRNLDRINAINASSDPNHDGWTIAKEATPLEHVTDLELSRERTIVIKGMGVVQPMLFGDFPTGYKARIWAQPGIDVMLRGDILPYIFPKV